MKLHIAQNSDIYGQNVDTLTFCGRALRRAIGWGLWGIVGHNRKDKCKRCVALYRAKRNGSKPTSKR